MKTKTLIITASLTILSSYAWSQVGIGVASPNVNSILDLTNTNNKGVLLPISTSAPTAGAFPEGMIFYYDSMIYVRNASGFNGITPWKYKFNGNTSEVIYYNPTSYIGVGIGVNDASIRGNFHVSLNSKEVNITGTSAAIFVGNSDAGTHMLIDNDEIMVKTNAATAGVLKFQEGGGSVQVGQSITNTSNFNVFGKVKENGNDLLPQGSVIMWSGGAIPNGWALCNGQRYQINTTTGVTEVVGAGGFLTPDLRDRFIVGSGATYTPGNTGGAASVAHTHDVNPASFTTPVGEGTHAHSGTTGGPSGTYDPAVSLTTQNVASDNHTHTFSTPASQGGHTHTIDVPNTSSGAASNTENRPPYYALAFIVKL